MIINFLIAVVVGVLAAVAVIAAFSVIIYLVT